MNLLIVTQKVDRADPILGFFHRWIEAFAVHGGNITVIAQQVGTYDLPDNVTVVSLRKEDGASNTAQILRFWKLIWLHRSSYNRVLVHMTPIWVILGAPLWLMLRKKIYLWYEIKRGGCKLRIALFFVTKVFAATKHGLPTASVKQVITGHGIDIDLFALSEHAYEPRHLVTVGRVTRIKQYELILKALADLPACRLTIAGGTITEEDKVYEQELRELMHRINITDRVTIGWVAPQDLPHLLHRAHVVLHASQGGLDKVVLQSMSCGTPVVSTSEAASTVLPSSCIASPESFEDRITALLTLSPDERQHLGQHLRNSVVEGHSVHQCIERLVREMQK